jgi:hypothetical protein
MTGIIQQFKLKADGLEQKRVDLPVDSQILSVGSTADGGVVLWAEVPKSSIELNPWTVSLLITGDEVRARTGNYITTLHEEGQLTAIHVYAGKDPVEKSPYPQSGEPKFKLRPPKTGQDDELVSFKCSRCFGFVLGTGLHEHARKQHNWVGPIATDTSMGDW